MMLNMTKNEDFVRYDLSFLERVFSNISNYEQLGIDINTMYQFSSKEKQVLLRCRELYSKVKLWKDYQTLELDHFSNEEALSRANLFLSNVFPKRKKDILALDRFVVFANISIYEAGLFYKLTQENLCFNQILIPSGGSNYTASIIAHEKMHALTFQKLNLEYLFKNGLELLPILVQKMMLVSLEDPLSNILDRIIRINDTKEAYANLEFVKQLNKHSNKSLLDQYVCNFKRIHAYDYLLGELYSYLLLPYYFSDQEQMLRKLSQVLEQKLSILDFLNGYQINLLNANLVPTIKADINKCKRISIIP